jgi:hypothetical protein
MPITWTETVVKALAGDEVAADAIRGFASYFDEQIGDGIDGMLANPQEFVDGKAKPCCGGRSALISRTS